MVGVYREFLRRSCKNFEQINHTKDQEKRSSSESDCGEFGCVRKQVRNIVLEHEPCLTDILVETYRPAMTARPVQAV